MTSTAPIRGAHLVGSVPLASAEVVFRTTADILGQWVHRLPDGETGERSNWIAWQAARFRQSGLFDEVPPSPTAYVQRAKYRPRFEVLTDYRDLPPLGYAAAALESYRVFETLRDQGVIPRGVRFQVCLPTPVAPVVAHISPDAQERFEPFYEQVLLDELRQIAAAIPGEDLAIQWDTAIEFAVLEGVMPSFLTGRPDVYAQIATRLLRLGNAVPRPVELGFHLCYGDANHKHFKEPDDTRLLVRVANGLADGLQRPLMWLHLPVPRDRADVAYFAPMSDLRLPHATELYLGLVHHTDGAEGTQRRIDTARQVVTEFGVATECGLGRRPPETVPTLLRIHTRVAEPLRTA
jgi:hypothetical protein